VVATHEHNTHYHFHSQSSWHHTHLVIRQYCSFQWVNINLLYFFSRCLPYFYSFKPRCYLLLIVITHRLLVITIPTLKGWKPHSSEWVRRYQSNQTWNTATKVGILKTTPRHLWKHHFFLIDLLFVRWVTVNSSLNKYMLVMWNSKSD